MVSKGYVNHTLYYDFHHSAQSSPDNQDQPSIATIEALPSSDFGELIECLLLYNL